MCSKEKKNKNIFKEIQEKVYSKKSEKSKWKKKEFCCGQRKFNTI